MALLVLYKKDEGIKMGLNFRKSISLGKGTRLNIGKNGIGVSVGTKGARCSISSSGRKSVTFGIPGTGLSYTKTIGSSKSSGGVGSLFGGNSKEKQQKAELEKNTKAVKEYEEEISEVLGIHKDGVDAIDWNRIETIPKELSSLRQQVLDGDIDAYYEVLEKVAPFDEILDFGCEFEIGTDDPSVMVVSFNMKTENVIPEKELKLTSTGKLSEKEMSKTTYFDILQDYVCSVTIRVAKDILSLLPVERVIVHAVDDAINPATGNEEENTYLSVIFDRETFKKLNLDRIDPSDSLENFEYNMKFNKTQGFKPVVKLTDW